MGRKRSSKGDKPIDPFLERKAHAFKALKAYCDRGIFQSADPEVIDVLTEESDRGAIILVGGVLEDVLAERIIATLPGGKALRGELLRRGGLLSSFQDKLTLAEAMGIIDGPTADSLDIIRQLRNAFAHTMRTVSMKIPAISGVVGLILDDEHSDYLKSSANDAYLRLVLGFIMAFHVERIMGKTQAEAQAVVNRLAAATLALAAEAKEKLAASPGKPPPPPDPDDPQNRKD